MKAVAVVFELIELLLIYGLVFGVVIGAPLLAFHLLGVLLS